MGENSKIEWTDHTFNPWIGCTKVAAGCTHCYAESFAKRTGKAKWGPEGTRVKTSEKYWQQPLKWNAAAECIKSFDCANGDHADCCPQAKRPRVFCASMADVFEDWPHQIRGKAGCVLFVCKKCRRDMYGSYCTECAGRGTEPAMLDNCRSKLFDLIDATPSLDWLLLTKRPQNIRRMLPVNAWRTTAPPEPIPRPNVWLGTSISDQETAEKAWYDLQEAGGLPRLFFLSIEPLLGPIDPHRAFRNGPLPHWVIVGGESGHHARPMHPDWVRVLRDFFVDAGVPFFFKQWGEWGPFERCEVPSGWPLSARTALLKPDGQMITPYCLLDAPGQQIGCVGKRLAGRQLDGREWNEFPVPAGAA